MADIYYSDSLVTLYHGDCIEVMRSMPDASVHAVITDPPYALGFMGREWDTFGDVGRGAQARVQRAGEVTAAGEGHSTRQLRDAHDPYEYDLFELPEFADPDDVLAVMSEHIPGWRAALSTIERSGGDA